MNRQGIMVDMSHASEKSFWDVIKLSKAPIICSHSSSMAMCKHDRNLTDEQLKALAQNGGVAQVCLLDRYINEDYKNASLTDAIWGGNLMRVLDEVQATASVKTL